MSFTIPWAPSPAGPGSEDSETGPEPDASLPSSFCNFAACANNSLIMSALEFFLPSSFYISLYRGYEDILNLVSSIKIKKPCKTVHTYSSYKTWCTLHKSMCIQHRQHNDMLVHVMSSLLYCFVPVSLYITRGVMTICLICVLRFGNNNLCKAVGIYGAYTRHGASYIRLCAHGICITATWLCI